VVKSRVSAERSSESDSVAARPPTASTGGGDVVLPWPVSYAWQCLPEAALCRAGPTLPPPLARDNTQGKIPGWHKLWCDTREEPGRSASSRAARCYRNYPERHFAGLQSNDSASGCLFKKV